MSETLAEWRARWETEHRFEIFLHRVNSAITGGHPYPAYRYIHNVQPMQPIGEILGGWYFDRGYSARCAAIDIVRTEYDLPYPPFVNAKVVVDACYEAKIQAALEANPRSPRTD